MTGVNGIIGYLLGTKQTSITIAELKQIFGEQAVSYSEMMGSYQALFYWEGFLIDCGSFDNDQTGTVTRFTMLDKR